MKSEARFDTDMANINSDKEKASSDANRSHDEYGLDMPYDPDAHLSAEEKAEVVGLDGCNYPPVGSSHMDSRNAGLSGGSTGCSCHG